MRIALPLLGVIAWRIPVAAHDGTHAVPGPSAWDWGALAVLGLFACLYAAGDRRLAARGVRRPRLERVAFWGGWVAAVAALAPPIDRAAALAFSMHMVQHELLMLVAAPLIILGRPILPWLWALPDGFRRPAAAGLAGTIVRRAWRAATAPPIAWGLHGATIWLWHAPVLYEWAVRAEPVHAAQHAMFAGSAVLFWWGLIFGRYGRAAYGASMLFVFTTMLHTGILGAIFAMSSSPMYAVYSERAGWTGRDPLSDQQLAGLYMWIPAGIVLIASGLALLLAWITEAERRTTVRPRGLPVLALALLAGSGCTAMPHEQEARALTGGDPYRGRERITQYGCDSCHTIPGIPTADATVGPPLTSVARRMYLAGHLENTPENMMRWIQNPHTFDQKTAMPDMGVTPADSRDIVAYLYTLR